MSHPPQNTRSCSIGIYRTATTLFSKEHVKHKIEALADAIRALPAAQQNVLKYEMLIQNNLFDAPMMALGFCAPETTVLVRAEFATADKMLAFTDDEEVQKCMTAAAEDFEFHPESATFSVDVETRVSKATSPATHIESGQLAASVMTKIGELVSSATHMFSKSDQFCVIGIHKVPADLSREEFVTKINAFLDKVCILPILKEKMVKLEMLSQNDVLDLHLKKKGLPTAQSTSILVAESKTVEDMLMLMGNPDLRHSAGQSGELQKGVSVFSVDVISKIGEH